MALRRPRRALVVLVGSGDTGSGDADQLLAQLADSGVEGIYLGRETDVARIAAAVAEREADAVELCLAQGAGVALVRDLLRALIAVDRRDASIVVHRVAPSGSRESSR